MTPPPPFPPALTPVYPVNEVDPWESVSPLSGDGRLPVDLSGTHVSAPSLDLQQAIGEGMRWLLGATVLRVGVEATLLQAPLWSLSGLVGLALLLAPAAIGLYISHCNPALRLVLAYRLMFIMLGLLLGGRL